MTKFARAHWRALHVSSELTRWFRHDREPNVESVGVKAVIAALYRERINPILMGAHGINVYRSETRATQDVDVLVTKKDVSKAIRILRRKYPDLRFVENSAVARLIDPATDKPVIDIMKPSSTGVQLTFRYTVRVGATHRIPDLEMALLCKFLAIDSPNRRETKRLLDLADFRDIVETNREKLNMVKLKRMADFLNPRRGAAIVAMVEEIDESRQPRSEFD